MAFEMMNQKHQIIRLLVLFSGFCAFAATCTALFFGGFGYDETIPAHGVATLNAAAFPVYCFSFHFRKIVARVMWSIAGITYVYWTALFWSDCLQRHCSVARQSTTLFEVFTAWFFFLPGLFAAVLLTTADRMESYES